MQLNRHQFAFYLPRLSQFIKNASVGDHICMQHTPVDFVHRLSKVVRMKPHDTFSLFDDASHVAQVRLLQPIQASKKHNDIHIELVTPVQHSAPLQPNLTLFISPLRHKEHMESVLFDCGLFGVNCTFIKTCRGEASAAAVDEKREQRFRKILIAGCEQGKHLAAVPRIDLEMKQFPHVFSSVCSEQNSVNYLLDLRARESLFKALGEHGGYSGKTAGQYGVNLFVGPEADWAQEELEHVCGEKRCRRVNLSQCVLESKSAVTVSLGILRCAFNDV